MTRMARSKTRRAKAGELGGHREYVKYAMMLESVGGEQR
jgi:hypothetical protein